MVDVRLPRTLENIYPGLPRQVELDAASIADVVAELDRRWPGLRDRLLEAGRDAIRTHIHFYVDKERAQLDTPLDARSRVDVITAISGG